MSNKQCLQAKLPDRKKLACFCRVGFQLAKHRKVKQLLLVLGSNSQAEENLIYANEVLSKLGKVTLSSNYINIDYTATDNHARPMYNNQCAIIQLTEVMMLEDFVRLIKQVEQDCGRKHNTDAVSLDIDVLAVELQDIPTKTSFGAWQIISERYPFKEHELVGITEVFLPLFTSF